MFQSEFVKSFTDLAVLWLHSPALFTFLQREKAYFDDF